MEIFSRSANCCFCPTADGYQIYEPTTQRIVKLNPLASLIIELCDGQRTVTEIIDLITPLAVKSAHDAVRQTLDLGLQTGILNNNPESFIPLDPQTLADQLRTDGNYEAAWICQYQAAELNPDDPAGWIALGELAHALGRRADARAAYEQALRNDPHDAELNHLLIALNNSPPPPRASNQMIEKLYERFAPYYEKNMLEELNYQAPRQLIKLITPWLNEEIKIIGLDLGCGSGLVGLEIRKFCQHLTGVDLSPQMIEYAQARAIYDKLIVAEIHDWLADQAAETFDLILACDVLVYCGDLRPLLILVTRVLSHGGIFAFSLEKKEKGEDQLFYLNDNGRYTHSASALQILINELGLKLLNLFEGELRLEYGEPVIGLYIILTKN